MGNNFGVEIFSVRKIVSTRLPESVKRFFVPNFVQTKLEDIESAIAFLIKNGKVPIPYIPVRKYATVAEVRKLLSLFKKFNLTEIVVLGGGAQPNHVQADFPFKSSISLMRSGLLQEYGIKKIGIAGHPEGHPLINESELLDALIEKTTYLKSCDIKCYIITQLVLNPENFKNWRSKIQGMGVGVPVLYGLMSETTADEYFHFAERCELGNREQIRISNGVGYSRIIEHRNTQEILMRELAGECDGFHVYSYGSDLLSLQKSLDSIPIKKT